MLGCHDIGMGTTSFFNFFFIELLNFDKSPLKKMSAVYFCYAKCYITENRDMSVTEKIK